MKPEVRGQRAEVGGQTALPQVLIAASALSVIRTHLEEAYPYEGCGVLIGRELDSESIEISSAIGTRNAEMSRGADRFTIEPCDLIAIERDLDRAANGERVVGYFHSHPDGEARPSQTDLEMAKGLFDVTRRFYVYAIASVRHGGAGEMVCWRLEDNLAGFVQFRHSLT